jgi:AbiV family abortive infection protein
MLKTVRDLIPPPGQFLLVTETNEGTQAGQESKPTKGKRLDIFREHALADTVYSTFEKCRANVVSLLEEAKLLGANGFYARSVALGITAWEELGKSQIAADYYTGVLDESEYKDAFRDHRRKTSYLVRMAVIDGSNEFKVATNPRIGAELEKIRQAALYVSEGGDPTSAFSKEDADFVIGRVKEHVDYIRYAEYLNERIGSKGLFK